MSQCMTKPTKWHVRQAKIHISLGTCQSDQSLLCTQWVAKNPSFLHIDREDSDWTGQMPRMIWVFSGRTCHFVDFVMRWLYVLFSGVYAWIIIILITGFLINLQVQGQHPYQWAPFQVAGLLHTWQISHQISRCVYHGSIACAIPHCHLLPCHIGPSRPGLSINLYVTGCLDCTIGAFHVFIPAEHSLLQYEVQILYAKLSK